MIWKTKQCLVCKKDFDITEEEKNIYDKIGIPEAKECFWCRMQHLLSFWVFGKFKKRKSDLSGEGIITTLPEKTKYPVYSSKEWYSDRWDPMEYGQNYDFSKSFFDQFKELQEKIPKPHQIGANNVDCDWCDDVWNCKSCYLSRSMFNDENISYCYRIVGSKDSLDLVYCYDMQSCYEANYCFKCFKVRTAFNCRDCMDSSFIYNCRNLQNCFMCWNLRNKQFYILNQPYSKEEYFKKISEYNLGSRKVVEELKYKFAKIIQEEIIHRENLNVRVWQSTGNYMIDCNRCVNSFHWEDSEDCYNSIRGGLKAKIFIDCVGCGIGELCGYSFSAFPAGYKTSLSSLTQECRDCQYLDFCMNCQNCFGCVGLRNKSFCILNKQYTEEEYKKLENQIIEQMTKEGTYGDFFPMSFANCAYNLSSAQVYFPEEKEKIVSIGGYWEDLKDVVLDGISTDKLPDDIKDVENDITTKPLICPKTGYRFNIAPLELAFYREMKIPLPKFHSDYRTLQQLKLITVLEPYLYKCIFCNKEIEAYYPHEWGYKKIACVDCYKKEVA